MLNHPDMEDQVPSPKPGKLVLPWLPDTPGVSDPSDTPGTLRAARPPHPSTGNLNGQISPAQLIRPRGRPAPQGLFAKLVFYWRKDPAYKVFMLAVAMVVLASIVFVSMAGAAWFGKPFSSSSYSQNPPTVTAPTGTVDLKPTFAPPAGGQGSGQSSQPPAQSTPSLGTSPTPSGSPTPSPTQPGRGGTLTAQIISYPPTVPNFTHVSIVVSTNKPGVSVSLYLRSNGNPRSGVLGPGITDASGNVTIPWNVYYFGSAKQIVTVTITAVAFDQNGKRAASSPVTVQVYLRSLP